MCVIVNLFSIEEYGVLNVFKSIYTIAGISKYRIDLISISKYKIYFDLKANDALLESVKIPHKEDYDERRKVPSGRRARERGKGKEERGGDPPPLLYHCAGP
jgi:hypothetical protein